ncbi:hypothetical protein [Amycolatopsis sp. MEPSY49]|uniref:hypothetical protein n=1 Tax=Amycolatopsis sp. MEPSY49 TaxID=3151600 RepID=UPI003EF79C30
MGRALSRVAGVVVAGALATFAATPAAVAQEETSTPPTETTTSTSDTTTSSSPASTTSEAPSTVPSSTSGIATADPARPEVKTTEKAEPKAEPEQQEDTQQPPKDDDYQDAVGHGFVGLGGEGVLVVACASGKVGDIYTQNLSVTAGPDQDESDGRYWNYTVTVVTPPAEATGRFAFFCDGVEHIGIIDFEQEQPPTSSSSTPTSTPAGTSAAPSSSAPVTTATSAAPGNNAPKAQVKVAPRGGVETGFGGTAG